MKNAALAVGMVAAVVLAFYPIYFRPKFFPEEYSEYPHTTLDAYDSGVFCNVTLLNTEEAQERNRATIPKEKLRRSGKQLEMI